MSSKVAVVSKFPELSHKITNVLRGVLLPREKNSVAGLLKGRGS